MQADVLQPLLETFYNLVEEEGRQKYSRTKEQQRFMLLHLLTIALIAEEYNMGGRQFEALRVYLKIEAKELVKYYRQGLYGPCMSAISCLLHSLPWPSHQCPVSEWLVPCPSPCLGIFLRGGKSDRWLRKS